jgi:nucleotide-binding universal stress UspA family protein
VAFVAPVLVCYDGSDGARAALEAAVQVFTRPMVIACYWQPFGESDKPLNIEILELVQDPRSINEREQARAMRVATQGAGIAEAAGATADPVAVKVTAPVDEAILAHADELDAFAIVLGSRSRSGLGSILLGDTAGDVVQLSNRPVFVIPSSALAERRRADRTRGSSPPG